MSHLCSPFHNPWKMLSVGRRSSSPGLAVRLNLVEVPSFSTGRQELQVAMARELQSLNSKIYSDCFNHVLQIGVFQCVRLRTSVSARLNLRMLVELRIAKITRPQPVFRSFSRQKVVCATSR